MSPITETTNEHTVKSTPLYHWQGVYFRLALMNEEHTIIHLYHGESFKSAEEAKAHGESAKFKEWAKRANMVSGWVIVKETHSAEEIV